MDQAKPSNNRVTPQEGTGELSRFAMIFASGTLVSRVLGLARDVVFAHTIPGRPLGAFLFAFSLPNMLRDMLGEGAVNAALVPVFSVEQEKSDAAGYREAVSAVMSMMLLLFVVITVIGIVLMPLVPGALASLEAFTGKTMPQSETELHDTVRLMQWTFPYLFFIGVAVFAMAPLFVAKRYGTPSWAPVVLNLAFIFCAYFLRHRFENPAWALVIGVWVGGLAQMAVLWIDMLFHVGVVLPSFRLRHAAVLRTFWLLLPVIIGQAAGEVNKLVDRFFAMSLGEDKVLALYISNRLVQLPLSIFGIAVAVSILPALSRAHGQGDEPKQQYLLRYGLRQSLFLCLPAAAVLLVLRRPIIQLLFQRGEFGADATALAAGALLYAAPGLVAFTWVKVMVQGFYARHDTRTPVIVATTAMLLNIVMNMALVRPMGYQGLALSTSISFTLNFLALFFLYGRGERRLWTASLLRAVASMAFGTAALALVAYLTLSVLTQYWQDPSWTLHLVIVGCAALAGALSYAAVCAVLRVPELGQLLRRFRRA
ncbi:MAG: murein biosynthesis integral membrane protein MurJ [Candidatus Hydrogenedentes bacterium]|nr:murein biosynthesis integral membrane protein MurJ [Candidatus Hydrogenedentota bacterium]